MSAETFWTYSLGALLLLQGATLAIIYRQQATLRNDREQRTLRRKVLPFAVAAILATGVWLGSVVIARSLVGSLPTFVDDIRNHRIPLESVQCIRFVKESAGDGPERILVEVRDRVEVSACLQALANSSVGLKSRNHPQGLYRGSLRFVLKDGTESLLPYFVMTYEGSRFVYFYSFHDEDYDWDQDCYESVDIIPFLARHDPQYQK